MLRLEDGARVRTDGKEPYIQAYVRVRPGRQGVKFKRFAVTSTRTEREAWREAMIRTFSDRPLLAGSFATKVQQFLAENQSKATIGQAEQHLGLWLAALGRDRDPVTITTAEINRVLDGWLTDAGGPRPPHHRGRRPAETGYAAGTVRKRRMWLRQFFVFLTGDGGPVQQAKNPKEPKPGPRGIDFLILEHALASMPTRRAARRGTVGDLSLAPIRMRVLMHTGLPPSVLMAVQPAHLDFQAATLYVTGREKGDGVEERILPLSRDAVSAFRAFHAADAYGPFSVSSLGRAVKAALTRSGYRRHFKLYDLRHSFLTMILRTTKSEGTVARLGLHAEHSLMPRRYTLAAHEEVDRAAVDAVSEILAARRTGAIKDAPGGATRKKLPEEVARNS
jgi:integrase